MGILASFGKDSYINWPGAPKLIIPGAPKSLPGAPRSFQGLPSLELSWGGLYQVIVKMRPDGRYLSRRDWPVAFGCLCKAFKRLGQALLSFIGRPSSTPGLP